MLTQNETICKNFMSNFCLRKEIGHLQWDQAQVESVALQKLQYFYNEKRISEKLIVKIKSIWTYQAKIVYAINRKWEAEEGFDVCTGGC